MPSVRGGGRGERGRGGEGALALGELVEVSVLAQHVDNLGLGARDEEAELGGGGGVSVRAGGSW